MPPDQDEIMLIRFEEALTLSALSSSTIINYLADLRSFLRWGKNRFGHKFSLVNVTQEHIQLYQHYLVQELKRAATTVNRHLMSLRKFFAFARQIGQIVVDPTVEVSLLDDDRQAAPRFLSNGEIDRLLHATQNGSRAGLIRRDRAILQLLLDTGLRVSELIETQKDDLIFDNPGVRLRVYNGPDNSQERHLPISSQVCKVLYDYLLVRPQSTESNHLFLSQDGRPISSRTVQRIINDCARTAGLKGITAQALRRTFALKLFSETNDLELVCKRLGHRNKIITEQYLAVNDN